MADLGSILRDNTGVYVVAEVTGRENRKAIDFSVRYVSSNYDIATWLSGRCKAEDIIIIPPFTNKETAITQAGEVAAFFRALYG